MPFSILSFDATEYAAEFQGGQTISVVGLLAGGGTISTSFTTAPKAAFVTPTFQTFTFDSAWQNLVQVQFRDRSVGAYDNIVVESQATAPESTSGVVWAVLAAIGFKKWRWG